MSETINDPHGLIAKTTGVVCAYVANHHVTVPDLTALVATVHGALTALATGATAAPAEAAPEPATAARIRKSITPDALISFIDGKPYKTLKRHLTKNGLDPRSYRERYGLPHDYPTTAASYSEHRSALARNAGLGHRPQSAAAASRRSAKRAAA